jgi:hypothetical protein
VVPGLVLDELNEYGEALYSVPDIQKMSHSARMAKYEANEPINSKKSDPKGYRKHAQDLNAQNEDFRHSVKGVKGWRHGCRIKYDKKLTLKAFHSELILTQYFTDNPEAQTYEALSFYFNNLHHFLEQAQIPDRADQTIMVDEYVNELSEEEKVLILAEIKIAVETINKLPEMQTRKEVHGALSKICRIETKTIASVSGHVRPSGAWAN